MIRHSAGIFRLLSLFSMAIAAAAVILVARGGETMRINGLIATALGTGFTVLVGTGLMTLLLMGASRRQGEVASQFHEENDR